MWPSTSPLYRFHKKHTFLGVTKYWLHFWISGKHLTQSITKFYWKKLLMYGVGGTTNNWFRNYLKDRKQLVQIPSGEQSELRTVNLGVPQGSVLGPLLFLLYTNDLAFCVPEFHTILFADDTSLSLAGQNYAELLCNFNRLLGKVTEWLLSICSV